MTEARTMIETDLVGPDLANLVQHARELHQMIGEELEIAASSMGERAGGVYAAMGDKLKELQALLHGDVQQR